MLTPEKVKNKKIVLDTNIICYAWRKDFGGYIGELLTLLEKNGNMMGCSEITYLEALQDSDLAKVKFYKSMLADLHSVPISKDTLENALVLNKIINNLGNSKKIKREDLIVAATVMAREKCLLLTANRKDFPRPYWETYAKGVMTYDKGEETRVINLYFLEFSLER